MIHEGSENCPLRDADFEETNAPGKICSRGMEYFEISNSEVLPFEMFHAMLI